ncbi:MAG TPA: GPR1/FUN34/YaaH family transporter [Mycobacteriales bacterium]|nr:GPR1/FUN34/YaaH family transporter [Mycobacteriales bacterium]
MVAPAQLSEKEPVVTPHQVWEARTRIVLSPVAPPSILGLYGFMGATLMVGAWQAGWYGDVTTPIVVFPFAMVFGGIAQFAAGLFSYRARDGLGTAVHGTWGSFWIAFGIFWLLVATHVITAKPLGAPQPNFAMWFVVLTLVTTAAALAALAVNLGQAQVLLFLAAGSGVTAAGFWGGSLWLLHAGGWLFVISAALAWYAATALMLYGTFKRVILPLGALKLSANIPGGQPFDPVAYPEGMPGSRVGQ